MERRPERTAYYAGILAVLMLLVELRWPRRARTRRSGKRTAGKPEASSV